MSVILKRYKGESTTFGFVLPDDYDLANMEDVKVYIGFERISRTRWIMFVLLRRRIEKIL